MTMSHNLIFTLVATYALIACGYDGSTGALHEGGIAASDAVKENNAAAENPRENSNAITTENEANLENCVDPDLTKIRKGKETTMCNGSIGIGTFVNPYCYLLFPDEKVMSKRVTFMPLSNGSLAPNFRTFTAAVIMNGALPSKENVRHFEGREEMATGNLLLEDDARSGSSYTLIEDDNSTITMCYYEISYK
jgi:hypothetical protein